MDNTEVNWALAQSGASVWQFSSEVGRIGGEADHVLSAREDQLWISGDPPQSVTLKLHPTHPDLRYAGWHVWRDYLTNPKRVEIASGATPEQMTRLLLCEAFPGAGTQVWRLPHPIPTAHLYVRFAILDTFGAGPTYVNYFVLHTSDPGPGRGGVRVVERETTDVKVVAPSVVHASSCTPPAIRREGATLAQAEAATLGAATPREHSTHPHTTAPSCPAEGVLSSRMNRLLKDLDRDIRSLKPIKAVSPHKNLLAYVAHDDPVAPEPCTDSHESDESEAGRHARRTMESREGQRTHTPRRVGPWADVAYDGTRARQTEERLGLLEQAVAALTQTVQHQREDLSLIKRVLLQQATERRRAAGVGTQLGHDVRNDASHTAITTTTAAAAPATVEHDDEKDDRVALHTLRRSFEHRLTHHHIDVDFPEDALRAYVESVLEQRLAHQLRRAESKALGRLEAHLRHTMKDLTTTVEQRVRRQLERDEHTHHVDTTHTRREGRANARHTSTPLTPSLSEYDDAASDSPPRPRPSRSSRERTVRHELDNTTERSARERGSRTARRSAKETDVQPSYSRAHAARRHRRHVIKLSV